MDDSPAERLSKAIDNRDMEGITQALEAGATFNDPSPSAPSMPLWLECFAGYGRYPEHQLVWEFIMPEVKNLSKACDYGSYVGLSGVTLGAGTVEAASTVALATIKE